MSTLTRRDPRPDEKTAEMSQSDDTGHPSGTETFADRRHQRAWIPGTAALLTLLIGIEDIVQVFRPGFPHRLHNVRVFVPGTLTNVTKSADVIIGLLLLLLAHGLRRRKRRAWQAVTALLAFDIGIHFFHSRHITGPVVALVVLVALVFFRDEFYAEGDLRNRWAALWAVCALVVADVAIGLISLSAAGGLASDYSLWQRTQEVVYGLVGVSGQVQWSPEVRGDMFGIPNGALGLFTLVFSVYLFLRPAEPRARLSTGDADRVRDLLDRYGDRDSLGYFALRNDKSVIWSSTGKACICYRVVSGVMLASGDPIGDPEAWPGAISPFLDEAARHAWAPAVMGCSELGAEIWCREGGLTALELGDEAIVEVSDFSLAGRAMRNVRQMVSRVSRAGYTAEIRRVRDISRTELDEIVQVADSWRGSQTERGFSMALGRATRTASWSRPSRTASSGPCSSSCRGAPTGCRWT
jgi:lysyl-tRNA synthetase, class II